MAFKGVTFAGQNVTPKDDGALYNAHYGDGILDGCSMAISGDDLVIQSGHFIAGGRVCHVDGATNIDLSGRLLSTGYIQVIMNYDLSQGEGSQWYTTFVESASTTFPALTQDDINGTGTLYQLQLGVVQISGGNLTDVVSQLTPSILVVRSANGNGIRARITGNGGSYDIIATDGTILAQLYDVGGNLYLASNGNPLSFRPNGINSSVGQLLLDTNGDLTFSGQQIGGHTYTSLESSQGVSVNANTWRMMRHVSGLLGSGIYLACGHCQFTPSANTASTIVMGLATTEESRGFGQSIWTASTGQKHINASKIFTGVTDIYLNFYGGVAGTINNSQLDVVRLA